MSTREQRRAARVLVLLGLYQLDVSKQPIRDVLASVFSKTANEALAEFLESSKAKLQIQVSEVQEDNDLRAFVENGVEGTWEHWDAIDRMIANGPSIGVWSGWRGSTSTFCAWRSMTCSFAPTCPKRFPVNEAVELAKIFGDEDSVRFVNGIFGCSWRRIQRTAKSRRGPLEEEAARRLAEVNRWESARLRGKPGRSIFLKTFIGLIWLVLAITGAGNSVRLSVVTEFSKGLPDVEKLASDEPSETTNIYSSKAI